MKVVCFEVLLLVVQNKIQKCRDVDVDNEYNDISTLWTLTTPGPWDATCE
jgi:hypothetical protein